MQSLRMALNPGIPPFTGGDDTTLTNAEYGSPHSEYEVSMMMADAVELGLELQPGDYVLRVHAS